METRIKTEFWVGAVLRSRSASGEPGMVLRRGDADAGGVLVVLRDRSAFSVLAQMRLPSGEAGWIRGTGTEPVGQEDADSYVARQLRMDPDLWVIEFDQPGLSLPFEGRLAE